MTYCADLKGRMTFSKSQKRVMIRSRKNKEGIKLKAGMAFTKTANNKDRVTFHLYIKQVMLHP